MTEQLEYHGLYVVLIATATLIVFVLAVAAVLEARQDKREGRRR